jgi:hypothetical protein
VTNRTLYKHASGIVLERRQPFVGVMSACTVTSQNSNEDGQPNDTRLVGLSLHSPAPVCTALMIFVDNITQLFAHCSFWCLRPSKHYGVLGHNSNIYSLVTVEEAAALGGCCTFLRVCLCIILSHHRNHLIVIERLKIIPTKALHKVSITSAQIQKLQNANSFATQKLCHMWKQENASICKGHSSTCNHFRAATHRLGGGGALSPRGGTLSPPLSPPGRVYILASRSRSLSLYRGGPPLSLMLGT